MTFRAQTKAPGDAIVLAGVVSVQMVRGMLVVKWGTAVNTYNDNDLVYWEVIG